MLEIADWELKEKNGRYDATSKYHKKNFTNLSEKDLLSAICVLTIPRSCNHCNGSIIDRTDGDGIFELIISCLGCTAGWRWGQFSGSNVYGWGELDF